MAIQNTQAVADYHIPPPDMQQNSLSVPWHADTNDQANTAGKLPGKLLALAANKAASREGALEIFFSSQRNIALLNED